MRLLVDTNIFLEVLLEQARANDAKEILGKADLHDVVKSKVSS
jgi:predicted nucleic acid-binding protein